MTISNLSCVIFCYKTIQRDNEKVSRARLVLSIQARVDSVNLSGLLELVHFPMKWACCRCLVCTGSGRTRTRMSTVMPPTSRGRDPFEIGWKMALSEWGKEKKRNQVTRSPERGSKFETCDKSDSFSGAKRIDKKGGRRNVLFPDKNQHRPKKKRRRGGESEKKISE